MTNDQTLVFIIGMLLITLSAVEYWKPQAKSVV